jgi:hypothetical protein
MIVREKQTTSYGPYTLLKGDDRSPSGVSRLSRLGGMRDGSVFTAVMRSVHKFSYGHKFERSAATPVVA